MLGTMHVAPGDVLRALVGQGSEVELAVVRSLRLPRVVLAALVGAGLGAAGAALQGATRNALAEPYLLGVSGGAAVGAVVAVALHAPSRARCASRALAAGVATPASCSWPGWSSARSRTRRSWSRSPAPTRASC